MPIDQSTSCSRSRILAVVIAATAYRASSFAATTVTSPDGKIAVSVTDTQGLRFAVTVDGNPVVVPSKLGLSFKDGPSFGDQTELGQVKEREVNEPWENRFGTQKRVENRYRESTIECHEGDRVFGLIVRAYNDGVALRYAIPIESKLGSFVITEEKTEFEFADDFTCWAGESHSSAEVQYPERTLSTIPANRSSVPPLLVRTPGAYVSVVESDVLDWPAMFVQPTGSKRVRITTPKRADGNGTVASSAPRQSPWRALIVARTAAELAGSQLVANLATPSRIGDDSWVKPGVSAWDPWWTGRNPNFPQTRAFTGVDSRGDTKADKDYIDLAAEMDWQYQLVDWMWYENMTSWNKDLHSKPNDKHGDFSRSIPQIDVPELVKYAAAKNVKILVWAHCLDMKTFGEEKALAYFASLGVAGVKIDFLSSQTQETVQWAENVLKLAAKYKLAVDYHGMYHATGLSRTYPNLLTQEGVLGNEYNKLGGRRNTPEHQLMLPFTRGLLGPMDYTPGGFLNRRVEDFKTGVPAQVMGTRTRELALPVLYLSPLTVMCDAPEHYRGQAGIGFYRNLPTVWDESRVLAAEVGKQIAVARRSGTTWYVAAINGDAAEMDLPLSFLPPGQYTAQRFEDDAASSDPTAVIERGEDVDANSVLHAKLARHGGFTAIVRPKQ